MASSTRTRVEGGPTGATARTIAMQVIAAILIAAAAHLLPGLFVPLLIALVLAICLSPLARRLEGLGVPRTIASLLFTAAAGGLLTLLAGLLVFQVNAIAAEMDEYLERLGELLGGLTERTGYDRLVGSLGMVGGEGGGDGEGGGGNGELDPNSASYWAEVLGQGVEWLGRWFAAGIGGLLGIGFGVVVGLTALFLMLQLRGLWVDRLLVAADRLGLCASREGLDEIRGQVVMYLGVLAMIATTYVVLISLLLWGLGVPRPMLWGVLSGMMEFIPIFGPILSGALVTVATLVTGTVWKPAVVAATYLVLHGIEGYVIWPVVFGRAIRFDQVTILVGILFFGGLLGPLGMVLGMPMLILLRGLIHASPGTPALDAIVEVDGCATESA